jgi:hypothetical protein
MIKGMLSHNDLLKFQEAKKLDLEIDHNIFSGPSNNFIEVLLTQWYRFFINLLIKLLLKHFISIVK